jgi:tripartite-type tricarboxylate transporter receptor subunit TctC
MPLKLPRRKLLRLAAAAAAFPALLPRAGRAQTYPIRPVRIINGFPAGSASDTAARLIGQHLSDQLGQPFVIENRTGAAGNLAADMVAHAPSDGYTLLLLTSVNAVNANLYDNLSFDIARDITPVAGLVRGPGVMEVNSSFPTKSVPEFIAYAKANPGKINMATAGSGSMLDVYGALFMMMAGVDMTRVPYRGTPPAVADLVSGQVQVIFDTFVASIALVRSGKLRALAVTTAARSVALPDVPSLGDFLPGYDASLWLGIGAPRGTDPGIVETLNKGVRVALKDPAIEARFAEFGYATFPNSPIEFEQTIMSDIHKWARVIKFASIKPD